MPVEEEEEELVEFLEQDQLAAGRAQRLPRARLSARAQAALWALRIFALVVGALVVYTFVAALQG
jgi:hypothetical protein